MAAAARRFVFVGVGFDWLCRRFLSSWKSYSTVRWAVSLFAVGLQLLQNYETQVLFT